MPIVHYVWSVIDFNDVFKSKLDLTAEYYAGALGFDFLYAGGCYPGGDNPDFDCL